VAAFRAAANHLPVEALPGHADGPGSPHTREAGAHLRRSCRCGTAGQRALRGGLFGHSRPSTEEKTYKDEKPKPHEPEVIDGVVFAGLEVSALKPFQAPA